MIDSIVVVVPAKDEQDEISDCLQSLMAARDLLINTVARQVSIRIIVVLDDCRDGTAGLVAQFPCVETVTCWHGSVGAARRAGVDYAISTHSARSLWIASTDADCQVPARWLVQMLQYADAGTELVLGTVLPRPGLPEALMQAWLSAHDSSDDHRHVHGANLGIHARTYGELGGWSALVSDEDVDLVTRAERSGGIVIQRSGGMTVTTSSRRFGRAPRGFAGYLIELEQAIGEAG